MINPVSLLTPLVKAEVSAMELSIYACVYTYIVYIYSTCLVGCLWGKTNMGRKNRADFHPIKHKMLQSLNIHSGMGNSGGRGNNSGKAVKQQ